MLGGGACNCTFLPPEHSTTRMRRVHWTAQRPLSVLKPIQAHTANVIAEATVPLDRVASINDEGYGRQAAMDRRPLLCATHMLAPNHTCHGRIGTELENAQPVHWCRKAQLLRSLDSTHDNQWPGTDVAAFTHWCHTCTHGKRVGGPPHKPCQTAPTFQEFW
ncbi:hypothetical protein PENSPDRAFT_463086 [Peniophora sp. CONT]|nr:hypothetical protein PENSPDRAFT_463086 [Peniophora sp. CONT]